MFQSEKAEGIVLKRINFSETDRILTFFTKYDGKISVLAKGVRKITSKRAGSVELFNNLVFFSHKTKGLDILTEVDLIDSFKGFKNDFEKVACAYYFVELVDKLTPENQENREVYELLRDYLKSLSTADIEKLTLSFENNLLRILGFGVPETIKNNPVMMTDYIESITERKINSRRIRK
ncbi:MAG: DNA repair protein RecO [Patescibacteria group bacterium]|nr:DNA repair protein RecO [Patescibacteria group bacterium]